jgi:GntR family transcriptional repressor for pyruvate dehydrogenase complex
MNQKNVLQKAVRVTLYENVMEQFEQMLREEVYKPGDRLLPERELASQLGISRNTLREALKSLELVGVLEVRQGGGYYLCESSNSNLIASSFRFLKIKTYKDMHDLLETRRILESANASLAATKATKETIERLNNDIVQMHLNCSEIEIVSSFDLDFHFQIAKASGNVFLNSLTDILNNPIHDLMLRIACFDDLLSKAIFYHEKILDAIIKRDPDAAGKYMNEHLILVENAIKQKGLGIFG